MVSCARRDELLWGFHLLRHPFLSHSKRLDAFSLIQCVPIRSPLDISDSTVNLILTALGVVIIICFMTAHLILGRLGRETLEKIL